MSLRAPTLLAPRISKKITSNPPRPGDGYSAPLLGQMGSFPGRLFEGTEYVQHAKAGGSQLLTTDYGVHPLWTARNCIFRYIPKPDEIGWPNGGRWCWRFYNLSGTIDRCTFAAAGEEHAFYGGIYDDTEITEVTMQNCGSQGPQISLKYPPGAQGNGTPESSPSWSRNRTLSINGLNVLECGRPGGTRLGFVFSVFKHGPGFELNVNRLFAQTVNQRNVVIDSSGRVCDSTGGIFVGYCKAARFTDSVVELRKPEKGCAQFYDYNTNAPSLNAPQDLELDGVTFIGGPVDVRLDETPRIRIQHCLGDAQLRLWQWKPATKKWAIVKQQSITLPYSQG